MSPHILALTAANVPIVEPTIVMKHPPERGAFLARAAMTVVGHST